MRPWRSLPPTAAPFLWSDLGNALGGTIWGAQAVRRFEAELKEYFDVSHVFLVSSGKAALTLILLALKSMSTRREVLIPAYTCYSVPSAIVKAGLKITVCDVEPNGFDFHGQDLEKKVGERTLCVISNHLFGIPSRIKPLRRLCKSTGAILVEDAAQAMGGKLSGRFLGTCGDVGFFSLGRGKNLACGSGGIILTDSREIATAIEQEYIQLRSPGRMEMVGEFVQLVLTALFIHPALFWFPQRLRFLRLGETIFHKDFPVKKLSAMKAAFLRDWRARLEKSNTMRAETAVLFAQRLRLSLPSEGSLPFLRLPVLVRSREERIRLLSLSREKGFGMSGMYPAPVHQIDEICSLFREESFPSAEELSERLVTLPTHPFVTDKDKEVICALLKEFTIHECRTNLPSNNQEDSFPCRFNRIARREEGTP